MVFRFAAGSTAALESDAPDVAGFPAAATAPRRQTVRVVDASFRRDATGRTGNATHVAAPATRRRDSSGRNSAGSAHRTSRASADAGDGSERETDASWSTVPAG